MLAEDSNKISDHILRLAGAPLASLLFNLNVERAFLFFLKGLTGVMLIVVIIFEMAVACQIQFC